MKRLFFILAMLPATAFSVAAQQVSISAQTFPYYQGGLATLELRVYPLNNFLRSDGQPVFAANPSDVRSSKFYSKVTCTVSGTVASCPAIVVPATEASPDNPTAKLGAYLFESGTGRPLGVFSVFNSFQVPASPTTTTWEAIRAHNIGTLPTVGVQNVNVTGTLSVSGGITGNLTGNLTGNITGNTNVGGTLTATNLVGNCSACTGIGVGTSTGHSAAGSVSIMADNDDNGTGVVDVMTRNQTRLRVENNGSTTAFGPVKAPQLNIADSPTRNTTSDPTPSTAPGFASTTRLYIGEGVSSEPAATIAPTINVERTLNPNLAAGETGFINFFRAHRTGAGNAYAVANLTSYFTSDSTNAGLNGGNDLIGISSHVKSLAGSFSRPYAGYFDAYLYNANVWATGIEIDVVNHSGQTAPIMSSGSPALGTLIGLQLTPRVDVANTLNREASTGIFFQSTPHPVSGWNRFRQGVFFAPNSITERGIDFTKLDLAYSTSPGFVSPLAFHTESYITYETGGILVKAFGMDASKVVWIGDAGAKVTAGGVFTSVSSRASKTNFLALNPREVLHQVSNLSLKSYEYKRDLGVRHIGPVAEEFNAAFGVGDSSTISANDMAGVALVAIKAINEKLDKMRVEIGRLKAAVKKQRVPRRRR